MGSPPEAIALMYMHTARPYRIVMTGVLLWALLISDIACSRAESSGTSATQSALSAAPQSSEPVLKRTVSSEAGSATGRAPDHAGASGATTRDTLGKVCSDLCERSRELKCVNAAECKPHCLAMASATPCNEPMAAFYQCLLAQPIKNWECAEDGVAAIRDGFCSKEQQLVASCMLAKMR
jgi:hypothetical protein